MLFLKGGKVLNADQSVFADVLCQDGKISQIGRDLVAPTGAKVIDVTGKLLVPGGIDPHTHMEMPFMGTVAIDDFYAGSRAALAGGTTTIIDFVIPAPGKSLLEAYHTWRKRAEKCVCDYSFHVAITWWGEQVPEEMGKLANEHGVTSFKNFMAYKGSLMLNDEGLFKSFSRAKELGCLSLVHAENGELVYQTQQKLLSQGITGPEGHPWSRPVEVEEEATNRAIAIAHSVNTPIYIVHVSCRLSMEAIQRARSRGCRAYGEALAGHLTLDDSRYFNSDSWNEAAACVMSPPFRSTENQEALWCAFQSGILQTTGTDHCTFNTEQKAMGKNDFTRIPNGTGGVEERMSVLYEKGILTGRISENEYVAITSTNAAKLFNLYPRKGVIAVGSDADIVVMDPKASRVVSRETHYLNVDYNVWEGWTFHCIPVLTISRGQIVWEACVNNGVAEWRKGTLTTEQGRGVYLPRTQFGAAFAGLEYRDAPKLSIKRNLP